MEENKNVGETKNCCEEKSCGNCSMHCGMHKCGHFGKCHMMRKVVMVILLIVVFCLGVQYGELKSEARGGYRMYRGNMMDWGYRSVKPLTNVTPDSQSTIPAPQVNQ